MGRPNEKKTHFWSCVSEDSAKNWANRELCLARDRWAQLFWTWTKRMRTWKNGRPNQIVEYSIEPNLNLHWLVRNSSIVIPWRRLKRKRKEQFFPSLERNNSSFSKGRQNKEHTSGLIALPLCFSQHSKAKTLQFMQIHDHQSFDNRKISIDFSSRHDWWPDCRRRKNRTQNKRYPIEE